MRSRLVLPSLLLVAACFARPQAAPAAEPAELVAKLPAAGVEAAGKIIAELLGGGEPAVIACCQMLRPRAEGGSSAAETALSGMAFAAAKAPEEQRKMYAGAVVKALDKASNPEVKAFLISLLKIAGKEEAVAPLGKYLDDENLCDPAVSALVQISTPEAARAVASALDRAKGKAVLSLVHAAGALRARDAAKFILKHAESDDRELRHAALFALANIPVAEAEDILARAAAAKELRDRTPATNALLLFARRKAEAGEKDRAQAVCRDVIRKSTDKREAHFVCAALTALAEVSGAGALEDLLAAADHTDNSVRAVALSLGEKMNGEAVTNAWCTKAGAAEPKARAEILRMLARRGDGAALPTVIAGLTDKEKTVRLAAIPAAAELAGPSAAGQLLNFMANADEEEAKAAAAELARLRDPKLLPAVADALPRVPPSARIALLKLLADRHATDQTPAVVPQLNASEAAVREQAVKTFGSLSGPSDLPGLLDLLAEAEGANQRAALRTAVVTVCEKNADVASRAKPVLDRLAKTPGAAREPLLEVLARLGGKDALDAVVAEAGAPEEARQTAAVRALAAWTDAAAVEPLLKIARESQNLTHHVLAVRGCVRLAETLPPEKRRPLLESLEAAARRDEEKTLIRAAMPKPQAAPTEAQPAAPPEKPADRVPPLGYPDAEGFVSLFNGKDLAGWVGAVGGYGAEDGVLYCNPRGGGNLFTAHEFTDFVLRFEFKLPAGANNGLAIRSPRSGNPAYAAMELQILDDTAQQYAKLQPYQYHGSIYGVAPAKRGHLKPTGEWNAQEVRAIGPKITVVLNGETIVDADLSTIKETADGKAHPGLRNETGHIGWLGHGSRVEFRNIRIKPVLPLYEEGPHNVPPEGFVALFNGKDLEGWKGLVGNPMSRAKMTPDELAAAEEKSWAEVITHWRVEDGQVVNDGGGPYLCTKKDYGDFELLVDYRTVARADSGVYLRGTPQVQIWDTTKAGGKWNLGANYGSGSLWNNSKNPRMALIHADKPFGEWNRLRILMVGERVTTWLNGQMTVKDTVMENYWDRKKPIYPTGQIELQTHDGEIRWRNIFIREIPRQ